MDKLTKVIKYSIFGIIVVIIVYDIILTILGYTISEVMRDWLNLDGWWIAPYYGSIVIGHWWINIWSEHNWWTKNKYRYLILIGVGLSALLTNIFIKYTIEWYVTMPLGLITGSMLWPQLKKTKQ